jgi:spiro-SPASM protein
MKCIVVISADLQKPALGTRSRLCDMLGGESILRRTLHRVQMAKRTSEICLIVPPDQQPAFRDLLHDIPIRMIPQQAPAPHAALVRAGRWWGLDSWRGGIGGLCAFDEDVNCAAAVIAASQTDADIVALVPAAAPLFDPVLLDSMIAHHEQNAGQMRLSFTQAPPGLSALIMARSLLQELAPTGQPPGALLTYQPDRAFADLTGKESCYRSPLAVVQARGRLIADTWRSVARIESIWQAGGVDWDALRISEWINHGNTVQAADFPEEIEIELTTSEVPGESGLLRPRSPDVPARGPMSVQIIERLCGEISALDDVRIVLGGFGEPMLHPQFPEICRRFRSAGAASIAVRTGGRVQDTSAEESLFGTPVDVVEVAFDAAGAKTYSQIHGVDAFEEVTARIERWLARRDSENRVLPLVVSSFIKNTENLDDMEPFFDHWQRRSGMAMISGYSHHAGQRRELAVTSTAPPQREPCRRSFTRTLILADGTLTPCDQDYKGLQGIGNLNNSTLKQLWNSRRLTSLRTNVISDLPLCRTCDEWHRP